MPSSRSSRAANRCGSPSRRRAPARAAPWKSGFYRIALAADLPVGLGYIDYSTRTIGIDTYIKLTGDVTADFARIRAFYKDKRGRRRENKEDAG